MLLHLSRARELMHQYNVDALVATTPVSITYLTDYYCWLDPLFKEYMLVPGGSSRIAESYAVLPYAGEAALTLGPMFAANASELWVRDLRLVGAADFDLTLSPAALEEPWRQSAELLRQERRTQTASEALIEILRDRGLAGTRIGIEGEGLQDAARAQLEVALPDTRFVDCSNLLRLIRAVKSPEELHRLRRAAAIAELAAMQSLRQARPDGSMRHLSQSFQALAAGLGAGFDHFAYGVRGLGIATEPEYRLTLEDVLYVDFGCIFEHYYSDSGVTLAMRELSQPLRQRHEALQDCITVGARALRPGSEPSAVQRAMSERLAAEGITASFPHGHGLGLEVRDYPIIVPKNGRRIVDGCINVPADMPLEHDMLINLEAAIFMPGVASLHVERSFVVAAGGGVPLVDQDRSALVYGV